MGTVAVRKFVLSLDPVELVDFALSFEQISAMLSKLGFEATGSYAFRYSDPECLIRVDLNRSPDGYFVSVFVQSPDHHEYRVQELAEAFSAHLLDGGKRPT